MYAAVLSLLIAAPVPPPAKVTPEMLVGVWHYEYGSMKDGVMHFAADGTYVAIHQPGKGIIYYGNWRLDGCEIELDEMIYLPDLGSSSVGGKYRFEMDMRKYPVLSGRCFDSRVVLRRVAPK